MPFHPVAPWSTVDLACPCGASIPIEMRAESEVRGHGQLRWAPAASPAFNPSFDVTPSTLVTSLVLDRGVFSRELLSAGGMAVAQPAGGALETH